MVFDFGNNVIETSSLFSMETFLFCLLDSDSGIVLSYERGTRHRETVAHFVRKGHQVRLPVPQGTSPGQGRDGTCIEVCSVVWTHAYILRH